MKKTKRHTVTAALPYANGPVHIGHLAGVYVPADIYSRYLKLRKKDVLFVCGSDEHGVPITLQAAKEGVSPQKIVDRYHELNKKSFEDFGISFDIYSRTTTKTHHKTSSDFFTKLYDNNEFIEKETDQYFDKEANQFLADRYIKGTCPKCAYEEAYGDQCEKCGSSLSPTELINPKSTISGGELGLKKTRHWFLPLDKHQDFLEKWILEEHKEWKPNVYGQCKSWLDDELKPRAVSRDLNWGVKVPVENAEGKVLYVWFDAPIGYISNTKEWAEKNNKDWKDYWCKDDTELVHFIGKDNIVFHCIIFPVMLKLHGDFILPENVPANEFLNLEGNKLSTSKNWAVWLHEYLQDFENKQDVLRYALTANAPETKDNDFTWKDFQNRNNNELVAILGNFVNRAIVLTNNYFDGKVPELTILNDFDKETIKSLKDYKEKLEKNIERFKFREALKDGMNIARLGNKYLADTEPWKLIKTDTERVKTILNISLQICANLSIVLEPFIPFSTAKLRNYLNLENVNWDEAGKADLLKTGHKISKAKHLFSKIEDTEIDIQIEKLNKTKKENEEQKVIAQKENIEFDDFTKLDIRTATIIDAKKVPKTDKLMEVKLDTGLDKRTVVAGIAKYHKAEDIIGKQVSVIVNLAPKKLRGIMSQGMILMAENNDGKLEFLKPENKLNNGSTIK